MIWLECVLAALLVANLLAYWRYLSFHWKLNKKINDLDAELYQIKMIIDSFHSKYCDLLKKQKQLQDVFFSTLKNNKSKKC